jgi:mannitol/fructose-specific phosphotransferase system IIA component (Ntr-type)
VFLFFLLLAPNVNQHLQTLGRLTRLLRDDQLREELLTAENPQTAIEAISNAESRLS